MSKLTNKQIVEGMGSEMSVEFNNQVSTMSLEPNAMSVYGLITDYPTLQNEFINTLINKIVKTSFYDKTFNNKLKMFHKGMIDFGASIEHIFVEMATKKGFREHFDGSTTVEGDLIGVQKPSVKVHYSTKNFEYKYKVTISEEQLRTAFYNVTGLYDLISRTLNSLTNAAYYDEYKDMKSMLFKACKGEKYEINTITGLLQTSPLTSNEVKNPVKQVLVTGFDENPKILSETLRALSGRLGFPSTQYNMSGVETWSDSKDLVFITTPELQAKLDVNVLADAFNVSMADIKSRTIILDSLPTEFISSIGGEVTTNECLGLLVDFDFLQAHDTILTMRKFDNGANLTVNHFLHKQGILSNCYFANALALIKA